MANKVPYRYAPPFLIACLAVAALPAMHDGESVAQKPVHESAVCLACHEGKKATLAGTAHALRGGAEASGVHVACTDCHGDNSKHWEEDPADNPMINPSTLAPAAEASLCATCHETSHQQSMLENNAHAASDINCSGCHSVHASHGHTGLLKKEQPALCYECHWSVEADFARSYRHPVEDGVITCSECHMTLDVTHRELSLEGTNVVCRSCHAEFQGPFPFEHQATLDYSTEEGGCLNCHAAHGSENPRILRQPYEPPHFQLCTQCHIVPPGHNMNPMHGTRWRGVACNECHTDIHGSYDNRFFLGEAIRAAGCLRASCHGH
jgi:DmsE family decaheme c-type cytochrome